MSKKKYAVIVTTYGEVDKVTIRRLWPSSRRILRVVTSQISRIPTILIYFIADYRSTKHYLNWKRNGYASSLISINRAQTERLRGCIAAAGSPVLSRADVDVFDSYYFVPPYLDDTLQQLRSRYDGIVVVPMFPVESAFSCGIACRMVMESCGEGSFGVVRVMSKLWKDEQLHRLYIDYLFSQLSDSVRARKGGKIGLVLVIHGTLVKDRNGNPPTVFTGLEETNAFFEVMKRQILAEPANIFADVRQGCMNHSRGGEWTSDTIEKAFEEFRREGYDAVVMFPYGFFADNSETELDARGKLLSAGFPVSQYVRCINNDPAFGKWLSEKVLHELQLLENLQNALEPLELKS
ncbi:MAG: ferrochelatase [Chlorobiaceae bacterium]